MSKITLSKAQWEFIGEKTGWLKEAKKRKNVNPWAVCHSKIDKDKNPEKFEKCVQDIKKEQHGATPDVPEKYKKDKKD